MVRESVRPRGALVLGADYRALGVVRSLGRRGVPVWVLAQAAEPLATVSRYAQRSLRWIAGSERDRIAFLCELADRHDLAGWLLIPSTDDAAAFLARGHAELGERFTHTSPAWDVVRWTYDKRLTYQLARQVGVPCPWTVPATRAVQDPDLALRFPAALKPAVKEAHTVLTAAKAWRVDDLDDLRRRYAEACQFTDPDILLVQELIVGGGAGQLSYAALCRDGESLAWLVARRTRQYPSDFGRASTFVESIDCPEVIEPSQRLLRELRYSGLIEIEYKRDPADGVLKLLDMNPRVWGWHTLCARAGVDFPWLQWLMATGECVPTTRPRPGAAWIRLSTDTLSAVSDLFARRLGIREYARSLLQRKERAIFAWDDPLPGLAEMPVLAYVLARRLLAGEAV